MPCKMRRMMQKRKSRDARIEQLKVEISRAEQAYGRALHLDHEEAPPTVSTRRPYTRSPFAAVPPPLSVLPRCIPTCAACITARKLSQRAAALRQQRAKLQEAGARSRTAAAKRRGKRGAKVRKEGSDPRKKLTMGARATVIAKNPGLDKRKLIGLVVKQLELGRTPASRSTVKRHLGKKK
jgi:hypothetical protein